MPNPLSPGPIPRLHCFGHLWGEFVSPCKPLNRQTLHWEGPPDNFTEYYCFECIATGCNGKWIFLKYLGINNFSPHPWLRSLVPTCSRLEFVDFLLRWYHPPLQCWHFFTPLSCNRFVFDTPAGMMGVRMDKTSDMRGTIEVVSWYIDCSSCANSVSSLSMWSIIPVCKAQLCTVLRNTFAFINLSKP